MGVPSDWTPTLCKYFDPDGDLPSKGWVVALRSPLCMPPSESCSGIPHGEEKQKGAADESSVTFHDSASRLMSGAIKGP